MLLDSMLKPIGTDGPSGNKQTKKSPINVVYKTSTSGLGTYTNRK